MNRRGFAAVAFALVVGLTGVVGVLGAPGLPSGDASPADATPAPSTDTPADTETSPTDEEIAADTRIVSTTKSLSLAAADGQIVRGATPLAPGTELRVSVRSVDGSSPLVKSVDATVVDDGSFRGTFDLSSVAPGSTVRVLVYHDGEEVANRTATVTEPTDGASIDREGDAVTLEGADGQVVAGTTDLEPGTKVLVRLHGSGDQVFAMQKPATVQDDGSFQASFDLSDIEPGVTFRVSVFHDGDRLTYAPGEVTESS